MEEHRLREFENRVLRKTCRPKYEEIKEDEKNCIIRAP
jgi:hypothetical protein